ncbi:MAG TPA: adenosylcobinamide amidohydrolase, partial [Veillonellaceae bacterium]|nr:adenosylcobinamide amidohydrolase [Veillonellaceae bacterium]
MNKEIMLASGGTVHIADDSLCITYMRKRYSLSSSVIGGGFHPILYAVNQKLTSYCMTEKDLPGGSVASYLRLKLEEKGCDPAQ